MPTANDIYLEQLQAISGKLNKLEIPECLTKPTQTLDDRGVITEDINSLQELNSIATFLNEPVLDLKFYIEKIRNLHETSYSHLVLLLTKLREEAELKKGVCQKIINEKLEKALGII